DDLKSGTVSINGRDVRVRPLSSYKMASEIAEILKRWIEDGNFNLTKPVEKISTKTRFSPIKDKSEVIFVKDLCQDVVTCKLKDSLVDVAKQIVKHNEDHIAVTDNQGKLRGIITSFDVTRAVAFNKEKVQDIVTKKVISVKCNETLYEVVRKLKKFNISAMPVVDANNMVLGIVSESMLIKNLVPKPNLKHGNSKKKK
ncbi:CBS domain-containing protein, partial [Candidatus Bathyarchaeota archaeon]|nr:CBS domain-containing protein [Candidatus Bathyarchaeota archaeon]